MAEITNNFYGTIVNNGTLNGDIYTPTYNCNGEVPVEFDADNMFVGRMGGIGERSQFWILLVASCARGGEFKNIPQFVELAFKKFKIPLDINECKDSTRETLKSKPWQFVNSQEKMIRFISDLRQQPNRRADDLRIANNIFVALKGNEWWRN